MTTFGRSLAMIALVCLASACGGYSSRFSGAMASYERYRYDDALKAFEGYKPAAKDELLYHLDKGMILHAAGRYEESITAFDRAEEVSERIAKGAGHQALSLAANDNVFPYVGATFERLLIPVWKALNYATLGKEAEALVEVRRYHTLYQSVYGRELPKPDLRNPFDDYFAGVVWEANDLPNDAYIDYRMVYKALPQFPYLASDLPRLATRLEFTDAAAVWESEFGPWPASAECSSPEACGELIVVLEAGLSPRRYGSDWRNPVTYELFPVPRYEGRPTRMDHVVISDGEETVAESHSLVSLTALKMAVLKDEMPAITARAVARTVAKEGAAVAVGKEVDENLGYLLGVLLLGTNDPDLRHWRTLPDTLQIARALLPPGEYLLSLRFVGKDGAEVREPLTLPLVEIKPGKKVFIPYRTFE